jgi:D-3-phosphoglycerate dehydrogenase
MSLRVLNMADMTACPAALAPLSEIAEVISLPPNQAELEARIEDFDAYIASLHVRLDRPALERARRLRAIATPSTGLDHIDVEAAKARGIEVLSLTHDTEFLNQITATAELAWALLLATVRRLRPAMEAARKGHWARDVFRGHQLSGKTLGVLGYGRLGRMVADYGKAFRMRVLACDTKQIEPPPGITMTNFETLLKESDVLSVHIHLTEANRGLIDAAALAKMKRGAILINTSRGAIVDEEALLDALQCGHLGGAGLDVIDGEWAENLREHPVLGYAREHENVVVSPHIGGVTYESQTLALQHTVGKLKRYLESGGKGE